MADSPVAPPAVPPTPKRDVWTKLRNRRDWRLGALILAGALCLGCVAVTLLGELWLVPTVWHWGFHDFKPTWIDGLRAVTGFVGAVFLASLSLSPLATFSLFWQIVSLYFEDADDEFKQKLDATKQEQHAAEERLKDIERQDDPSGLIQLVQYSRLQLEQYYTIAIRQTQQSFRYSVVAMWIGFVVMVGGVIPFVLPLFRPELKASGSTSINVLISAGGFVIELIAALFLWVYRSSISQLTYFYNRQIYLHNVLLCYKIAATMKPEQDPKSLDAKTLIIQKVLDSTWSVERPEAPSASGMKNLFTTSNAAAAGAGVSN